MEHTWATYITGLFLAHFADPWAPLTGLALCFAVLRTASADLGVLGRYFFHKKTKGVKQGMCFFYYTLPKFNIAPEKWWLEDYFPIGKVTFQGLR